MVVKGSSRLPVPPARMTPFKSWPPKYVSPEERVDSAGPGSPTAPGLAGVILAEFFREPGVVKHCTNEVGPCSVQVLLRLLRLVAPGAARAYYEDDSVGLGSQDSGVGHNRGRWRIDQDQ